MRIKKMLPHLAEHEVVFIEWHSLTKLSLAGVAITQVTQGTGLTKTVLKFPAEWGHQSQEDE
jgi:hypothetical protein